MKVSVLALLCLTAFAKPPESEFWENSNQPEINEIQEVESDERQNTRSLEEILGNPIDPFAAALAAPADKPPANNFLGQFPPPFGRFPAFRCEATVSQHINQDDGTVGQKYGVAEFTIGNRMGFHNFGSGTHGEQEITLSRRDFHRPTYGNRQAEPQAADFNGSNLDSDFEVKVNLTAFWSKNTAAILESSLQLPVRIRARRNRRRGRRIRVNVATHASDAGAPNVARLRTESGVTIPSHVSDMWPAELTVTCQR